ncbi:hypothetical protein CEXT_112441 [Caerostris extrusa]|uniref:Anoctamin n=1 Tax=Caerostris extrusa TaxID=172846 RepID=A0AAV4X3V4_CAEEX|nr:hypothetical protein CEXT_112441 [Caerostris extrusa]
MFQQTWFESCFSGDFEPVEAECSRKITGLFDRKMEYVILLHLLQANNCVALFLGRRNSFHTVPNPTDTSMLPLFVSWLHCPIRYVRFRSASFIDKWYNCNNKWLDINTLHDYAYLHQNGYIQSVAIVVTDCMIIALFFTPVLSRYINCFFSLAPEAEQHVQTLDEMRTEVIVWEELRRTSFVLLKFFAYFVFWKFKG